MMDRLFELYQIAEQDNIVVDCMDLSSIPSLSLKDENGDCYIALDPFKLESSADEKYKLAHELGHCKTGCFYNRCCLYEIRERYEWRAEKWAIKKLVPKDELQQCHERGIVETWEIAEILNLPEKLVRKAMEYYHEQELAG